MGSQAFALHLDLGPVPASLDEVLVEIGDRLDHLAPRLWQEHSDTVLTLTIEANDLWLAVLLAMAAVTGTGYPVVRVDGRPVVDPLGSRHDPTSTNGPRSEDR